MTQQWTSPNYTHMDFTFPWLLILTIISFPTAILEKSDYGRISWSHRTKKNWSLFSMISNIYPRRGFISLSGKTNNYRHWYHMQYQCMIKNKSQSGYLKSLRIPRNLQFNHDPYLTRRHDPVINRTRNTASRKTKNKDTIQLILKTRRPFQ